MYTRFCQILTLFFLISLAYPARSTHLVGGSVTYKYMGKIGLYHKYRLTFRLYRDCYNSNTPFDPNLQVGIYPDNGSKKLQRVKLISKDYEKPVKPPAGGSKCAFQPNVCIREGYYQDTVLLRGSNVGYHLVYIRCCRNNLTNISNNDGQTYHTYIPPTQYKNSSPYFTGVPAPYICANDSVNILYSTKDPDGDSLVYKFVHPYTGADTVNPRPYPYQYMNYPVPKATYYSGYNKNNPFGNGGISRINSQTGLATLKAPQSGKYAIAVDVLEYRNGKLISKTRRDIQIISINCPNNPSPKLVSTGNNSVNTKFTVSAGDTLTFPMEYEDKDSMYLTRSGDIFSGSASIRPPYARLKSAEGKGKVKAKFYWPTGCHHARKQPYIVTVKVDDNGCPPKTTYTTFIINVESFDGPGNLTGPDTGCLNRPAVFRINRKSTNSTVNWFVKNGSYSSDSTKEKILVNWNSGSKGEVKVIETSPYGCPGDTLKQSISIFPPPVVDPGPDTTICGGDTIQLGPSSILKDAEYIWPDSTHLSQGNVPNPVFTFQQFGTSPTLVEVPLKVNQNTCISIDTVKIAVDPKPYEPAISGEKKPCYKGTFTYRPDPPDTAAKYQWSVLGGSPLNPSVHDTFRVKWQKADTAAINLVKINNYGCVSDTHFSPVKVSIPRTDTIIGSPVVCPNSSRVAYWVKNIPGSTFEWLIKGGKQVDGGNSNFIRVDWGDSGRAEVAVIEINKKGCQSDTVRFPVHISYRLKTSPISGDTSVCEFSRQLLYAVFYTNGSNYDWTVGGGALVSRDGEPDIKVNWGEEGKGLLKVVETSYDSVNNKPCIGDPVFLDVDINPLPETSEIKGKEEVCQEDETFYHVRGFSGSSFFWELNPHLPIQGQKNDTIQIRWAQPGEYKLTVKELTKDSCWGKTKTLKVIVHPKPQPREIFGKDTVCVPAHKNVPYKIKGWASSIFHWNVKGGRITSGKDSSEVTITWTGKRAGEIKVREETTHGCRGESNTLKVLLDFAAVEMNLVTTDPFNDNHIRLLWEHKDKTWANKPYKLYRATSGEENWQFLNQIPLSRVEYIDTNVLTHEKYYDYKITNQNLCGLPVESKFHRSILLQGNKPDKHSLNFNWNHYKGWGDQGVEKYKLYRKINKDRNFEHYTTFTPDKQKEQMTVGTDGYKQCYRIVAEKRGEAQTRSWSNDTCFYYDAYIYVPSAFTPEGNGLNDEFRVVGSNLKTFDMKIFSRWGEKLYESGSLEKGWDGTYKGKPAPSGSYLVLIKYKGNRKNHFYKGSVTLLR